MIQHPDPKLEHVPTHHRLYRRGSVYYFRVTVPEELRPVLGCREIKYSLKTTDPVTARRKVNFESELADRKIEQARAKLAASPHSPSRHQQKRPPEPEQTDTLIVTSEADAMALAKEWLVMLEREGEKQKHGKEKKPPFTVDQLNRIFSAPLYTGAVDDERGYATS